MYNFPIQNIIDIVSFSYNDIVCSFLVKKKVNSSVSENLTNFLLQQFSIYLKLYETYKVATNIQQHHIHLMIKVKVTLTDAEGHRWRSKVTEYKEMVHRT